MALLPTLRRLRPPARIQNLGTAWAWLEKLYAEMSSRQLDMEKYDKFYRGEHPMPFLTQSHHGKMWDEFYDLLRQSKSNFMELVVDAVSERLRVVGFRVSASSGQPADQRAWDIWQANGLDADSITAMDEALIKGVSYLSVWKDLSQPDSYPTIAIEDGLQCIVGYVPGTNYKIRAAALKCWTDDWTGDERANVYLPDGIYKFKRTAEPADQPVVQTKATGDETVFGRVTPDGATIIDLTGAERRGTWVFLPEEFVDNPWNVVPIVPLRNKPRLKNEGVSELDDVVSIQEGINGFLFLLALAGYFGAHRQRWAVGITLMKDSQGKPIEPFKTAVDTLWVNENPAGQFGEFGATDLDPYIKAIEQKLQHIAVISRTPRHYLMPEGQEPSGDSLRAAESGLMSKVGKKQPVFAEGFEAALQLARRMDNPDAQVFADGEIVWADTSSKTLAEVTDATMKQRDAGLIDDRQALENLGYTPVQIERILESDRQARTPTPALPAPETA